MRSNWASKSFLIFRTIWVGLCVAVLLRTLISYYESPHSEVGLYCLMTMTALSFPSGYLLGVILGGAAQFLSKWFSLGTLATSSSVSEYLGITFTWTVLFTVGYFQWFVLPPYLARKIKARKLTKSQEGSGRP
jgi:hypothetical protein